MMETIFVMAAAVLVFILFFLAFLMKGRSTGDEPMTTCANCTCHRGQKSGKRSLKPLKQMENEIQP